jgi:quercetin dioxygenase-like cupin family protein
MIDVIISPEAARERLIRRADYVSCPTAFIDCKKPGSHLKQNYSMIGPGVTTSPDQVVNLREPHGFNIGAAAMPKGIVNNLHIHFTAEVFFVFGGSYVFRWGDNGADGEILGEDGDVVSVPTWIFRGFTNVGPDDAMVFTALGGDDTGGLIWHPSILEDAATHGLYLTKESILVDTATGVQRPPRDQLIEPISAEEIASLRRYSVEEMRKRVVKSGERAWSNDALLDSCLPGHASALAPVIGHGISQDRAHEPALTNPHGFSVEWLRLAPGQSVSRYRIAEKQVLIAHTGACTVTLNDPAHAVELPLGAWDMVSIPAQAWRGIRNTSDTTVELLVITSGEGRKTPEWPAETIAAAHARDRAVDRSGLIAPAHLLPNYVIGRESAERAKELA